MAGVRAPRYCYPHCLLGKKVVSKEDFEDLCEEQQKCVVTKEERDEQISKEDNLRDLYYHAYLPTPADPNKSDKRSLVVDLRRRLYRGRAIEPRTRSQHCSLAAPDVRQATHSGRRAQLRRATCGAERARRAR